MVRIMVVWPGPIYHSANNFLSISTHPQLRRRETGSFWVPNSTLWPRKIAFPWIQFQVQAVFVSFWDIGAVRYRIFRDSWTFENSSSVYSQRFRFNFEFAFVKPNSELSTLGGKKCAFIRFSFRAAARKCDIYSTDERVFSQGNRHINTILRRRRRCFEFQFQLLYNPHTPQFKFKSLLYRQIGSSNCWNAN